MSDIIVITAGDVTLTNRQVADLTLLHLALDTSGATPGVHNIFLSPGALPTVSDAVNITKLSGIPLQGETAGAAILHNGAFPAGVGVRFAISSGSDAVATQAGLIALPIHFTGVGIFTTPFTGGYDLVSGSVPDGFLFWNNIENIPFGGSTGPLVVNLQ